MDQPAIIVNDVSKKFARSLKRGMIYGLSDMAMMALLPRSWQATGIISRLQDARRHARGSATGMNRIVSDAALRPSEFWALRNVSFTVGRGETLALLGANGAGKSTLFSILSGIYAPTHGSISYTGRLQALIALGAGFHPALTGRENLYINAAILGMKENEVNSIYDKIVDFSGIGAFIDSPIRNYSSGMVVRLAFSIAVHLDPDVLLIDEVLAVGDAEFQMKCARYTRELADSGKTILVVSHNMLIVQMMCKRAIWLEKGRVVQQGDTHEVTREYQKHMMRKGAATDLETRASIRTMPLAILGSRWLDMSGSEVTTLQWGRKYKLRFEIASNADIDCAKMWVSVGFVGGEFGIMGINMFDDGHYMSLKKGTHHVSVIWDSMMLGRNNDYRIQAGIRDWSGQVLLSDTYSSPVFEITHESMCQIKSDHYAKTPSHTPVIAIPYTLEVDDGVEIRTD